MGTIVVSYVDKPEGRAALQMAVAEAERRDGRLIIVDASPGTSDDLPAVAAGLLDVGTDESRRATWQVRRLDADAPVAEAIIQLANEADADLIVIGLRQRSGVGKLMLGTNAQRILLDASCPVLTVKARIGTDTGTDIDTD